MLPEPTDHDLADCLGNLRRCFTHRLKLLEKYYNIRAAIDASQKRPLPELLAEVGIIRPVMLKALLNVRNEVEYADAKPPSIERCGEFAEAVWYLLRSTDSLLEVGRTEVFFDKGGELAGDPACWFCLHIEYKPKLTLQLRGKFSPDMLSCERRSAWMELDAEHPADDAANSHDLEKNGSERFVMGTLNLLPEARKTVLRAAFDAVSA